MAQSDPLVIDRADHVDRYRYRCPRGHTCWSARDTHLYCDSCARRRVAPSTPEWRRVLDSKTGERIQFSSVEVQE